MWSGGGFILLNHPSARLKKKDIYVYVSGKIVSQFFFEKKEKKRDILRENMPCYQSVENLLSWT